MGRFLPRRPFLPLLTTGLRLVPLVVVLVGLQLSPQSDRVARWVTLAERAAKDNEYDEAVDAYIQVEKWVGPQSFIYEQLVELSLNARRYVDARVYLYALADRSGWTDARRAQLVQILEQDGTAPDLVRLLNISLDSNRQSPRALRRQAQQQIASLDWVAAESTLRSLVELAPDDAQAAYQLGMALAPSSQDEAESFLARAAQNPEWAARADTVRQALGAYTSYSLTDAHTALGIALVGLDEWPFAEHALGLALVANAVNPTARAYLGFVRDRQGRDGLPDIEAALAMNPNDPVIYYLMGLHWRQVQAQQKAYDAFTQAYWLDPNNPALAAEVGTSLQNQGDFSGAENWLRIAVELAPSDIQWRRLLAAFFADTGYALDAGGLEFIDETAQLAPDDPDVRASLGWAYNLTGDTSRAFEALSAAVGMDPSRPRSRYYFGVLLERRNDQQGAIELYLYAAQAAGPDSRFGALAARALRRLGVDPGL